MTGAEGSLFIRELRLALFSSQGQVQVMVLVWVVFSVCFMLPLLPGFHFLGGFGDLAGTGSGRQ